MWAESGTRDSRARPGSSRLRSLPVSPVVATNVDFDALRTSGCVVTGGLGFIGSNLVHRLVAEGVTVRVIDAVVAEHGANRRNLDGLEGLGVEVLECRDRRTVRRSRAARGQPRVQPRRPGEPHGVDDRPGPRPRTEHASPTPASSRCCASENPTARVVHTSTRQVYGRRRAPARRRAHRGSSHRRQRGRQARRRAPAHGVLARPSACRSARSASPTCTALASASRATSSASCRCSSARRCGASRSSCSAVASSVATACSSTTSSTRSWPHRRREARRLGVQRRPRAQPLAEGDRRDARRAGRHRQRGRSPRRGRRCTGRIDIGSFETDSTGDPHRTSAGRRVVDLADGLQRHPRLLPGAPVVPVVDLSRHAPELVAAVPRPRRADRWRAAACCSGPRRRRSSASSRRGPAHAGAVAVSSGASAFQLALAALGVGPGDEVIVPAFTAVPTASAVCALGATPVFVDVDRTPPSSTAMPGRSRPYRPDRGPSIVVHLYGRPADAARDRSARCSRTPRRRMARSTATTPRRGQWPTASTRPRTSAASATAAPSCPTTPSWLERVRRLRVHGMTEQYVHEWRVAELPHVRDRGGVAAARPARARRLERAPPRDRRPYRAAAPDLRWHDDHPDHVHHLCVFRAADRDAGPDDCSASSGVATGVHYPLALTQQPAYRHLTPVACPRPRRGRASASSVPCFPQTDRRRDRPRRHGPRDTARGRLA